jgi:hypothetical protein
MDRSAVADAPETTRHMGRAAIGWLLPSFGVLIFLMHPVAALLHPDIPLSDPGTGWHLATGRYVLDYGAVPAYDVFSWTAAGKPDVSFYWLFDVLGAALVRLGGLPLFTGVCVLAYGLLPLLLYRRMLRMGAALAMAVWWSGIAYVVLLSHALARPHIVTYLGFTILLDRLDRFDAGTLPGRALWWLPLLVMLWCNMHGGFLIGLLVTGLFAAVVSMRAVATRDASDRRRAVTLVCLVIAMVVASGVNPNGFRLLEAAIGYFSLRSPAYFTEFQSPDFLGGGASVRAFELLVIALVVWLATSGAKLRATEWLTLVVLLHMALASIRHMNLFALAAAPILARGLTPALDRAMPRLQERARRLATLEMRRRSDRLWIPAMMAVFVAFAWAGRTPFPRSLEGPHLSAGAADYIALHADRFDRMFNTESLGGALIWHFWPTVRVFADDRVPVYGDEFIIDEYLAVLRARPSWREVLERWDVTSAVVKKGAPCVTLLREARDWHVEYEDAQNAIFFRRDGT